MRPMIGAVFLAGILAVGGPVALGLDFADMRELVNNKVPESVIANMVEGQGRKIPASEAEINELAAMGVSRTLIEQAVVMTEPATAVSVPAVTSGGDVLLAPVTLSSAYPALSPKEGWVAISNRDWKPYYLTINEKKRMFLAREAVPGGLLLPSGQTVVLNLRKDDYKLYGGLEERLNVKIREGQTTTVSLEPFGKADDPGLRGVAIDGDKVRTEVLFAPYAPPPVVVVRQERVVVPPPVYYYGHPGPVYVYP